MQTSQGWQGPLEPPTPAVTKPTEALKVDHMLMRTQAISQSYLRPTEATEERCGSCRACKSQQDKAKKIPMSLETADPMKLRGNSMPLSEEEELQHEQ